MTTGPEDRRKFLKGAAAVPAALLLAGEASLLSPPAAAARPARSEAYEPVYFTPAEWAFINAATDRLIPSDEHGPGAVDLNVPEFIDRQMETEYGHGGLWYLQGPFHPEADATLGYQLRYSPRDFYRVAIAEINLACRQAHDKDFADLPAAMQDVVLSALEKNAIPLASTRASEFFIQLLANTREGYFADPMYGGNRAMGGWKMIGFPGARADFKDWSARPGQVYPLGPVSIRGGKG
ncbi:gluconate 2-dehydrogenase subunit 3 family protein [Ramlibacter sp.]|uniref:gluconate 2-dehydrogenase subunit 3 family protein n=1 Tax=Ramlibacter sp. TaxID=1917967 RepID=UPI002614287F|nr:gluconate 2-dehydrogenase subunit 3 family protein [Ramlibacter sp.]MDB5955273.1 hypothetical protein [Ramlibacter sp.]